MQQIAKVVMNHWHLMPLPLRVPVRLSPYANSLRPSPPAPFSRDKDIARLAALVVQTLSAPSVKVIIRVPMNQSSECQAFLMCQLLL